MAASKRTPIQIERDRRDIANLYLQGWTQHRIVDHLNAHRPYDLSRQMISYDLGRLRKQWRESALIDIDEAKARELAKVDRLEREYWQAWGRSCLDAETTREETDREGGWKRTDTHKGQSGDPRFLAGVGWCVEKRCDILGIEAPKRFEHGGPGGGPIPIRQEVVREIVVERPSVERSPDEPVAS